MPLRRRQQRTPYKTSLLEPLESRSLLSAAPLPYGGTPATPGQTIEAENFDQGGQNVAYYIPGGVNESHSAYRGAGVGVADASSNLGVVGAASNGHYVGYTSPGEWLDYTVDVEDAGSYILAARVASAYSGASFGVSVDGGKLSSPIAIPTTPTWTSWHTALSNSIYLSTGEHVIRLTMLTGAGSLHESGNYDSFNLVQQIGGSFGWTKTTPSTEKQFEGRAVSVNGKLYTFGGYTAVRPFGANETYQVFNPATDKWTNLGKMPAPETHSGVAVDQSTGIVYFVGGLRGLYPGTGTSDVYSYNTNTNVWTKLPSLPEPLSAGSAAIVNGVLHYMCGNIGQQRDIDQSIHLTLDLNALAATGKATWQTAASLPQIRDHVSAVSLNGKIYVVGGEIGHDKYHLQQKDCFVYDPTTNSWSQIADIPVPLSHAEAATFTADGKIIIAGGQVDDYGATKVVMEYDPTENRWFMLPSLPTPLEGTIMQEVGDEVVLSAGYDGVSGVATNATYIGHLPQI